jgi:hypothetical protein
MPDDEQTSDKKERSFGVMAYCTVAASLWWFLSSEPSTIALALVGFLLFCICSGYCVFAVLLPGPDSEPVNGSFVPLHQHETVRVKSISH